jgi:hypothetical protein
MTGPGGAPVLAMLAKGETIEQVPGQIAHLFGPAESQRRGCQGGAGTDAPRQHQQPP